MGWDYSWPKIRTRMGKAVEIKRPGGSSYRFCDHTSSHTMRRTAITTLLMLDVPENIVRMVSGHSPGSREFYRYVGLAQGWMDEKLRQAQIDLLQGNTSPKISKLEN